MLAKNLSGLILLLILGGLVFVIYQFVLSPDSGNMTISSPAFAHKQLIPEKYTCDGANVSPPLVFSGIPEGTRSLALIVDDPDAAATAWTHWTIWDIDPATVGINEGSAPRGATQGLTSFGDSGYGGPCPPRGVHRYFFKLYALDVKIGLGNRAQVSDLEAGLRGHILEEAELVGLYTRDEE